MNIMNSMWQNCTASSEHSDTLANGQLPLCLSPLHCVISTDPHRQKEGVMSSKSAHKHDDALSFSNVDHPVIPMF